MNTTYTVADVLRVALSKVGVDYGATDAQNIEDAHRNLNLMLDGWGADPDIAIARIVPMGGYTSLTDTIDAPGEYSLAMALNLALLLASDYDQSMDKLFVAQAASALENIKTFNIRRIGGRIPANIPVVL